MKRILLILVAISLISSCKEEPKSNIINPESHDVLTVEIPSEFVTFYNKFHSDSIFQMNHIVFPLAEKTDGTKWQKENWKIHKAFDDQNGAYKRSFDNFSGIIFETIIERTGAFKIVKRYSKVKEGYNLIYYKSEVMLDGWKPELG